MPKIDRRTFALGVLVVPLAGCADPGSAPSGSQAYPPPVFRNDGYWMNSSTYVATGGIKPT
jgi:hypothetical protein